MKNRLSLSKSVLFTKQSWKANTKCHHLEKFTQHCQSGILHIPKEHPRNGWKTPKNITNW